MEYESKPQPETLRNACVKHNIGVESVFVPWSKSRNKDEKNPSLNWYVTITKNGVPIVSSNYSSGCGHCPAYKKFQKNGTRAKKYEYDQAIKQECQDGFERRHPGSNYSTKGPAIKINPLDVVYSLVSDSDAINYCSYEDWAESFGYDTDSRKGEAIYQACLTTALKLRNGFGEQAFQELQEAIQDY